MYKWRVVKQAACRFFLELGDDSEKFTKKKKTHKNSWVRSSLFKMTSSIIYFKHSPVGIKNKIGAIL